MATTTLERPTVAPIAPAVPLTEREQDALITLAASTERTQTVRSTRRGEARAWSLGGNVD